MACFVAPTVAAIITTRFRKKVPAKLHIEWLILMLWGGVIMLIVDHLFTGELVPFPPFLTAMQNPTDIPVMVNEILTVGTTMTVAIFFIWAVMVFVYNKTKICNKDIKPAI